MRMYQLHRALCAVPVDHQKLSCILYEVADFCEPKVQERGYYCLRPEWWTKFDPLFPLFYPNELEDAQERAGHVGKQQFYWRIDDGDSSVSIGDDFPEQRDRRQYQPSSAAPQPSGLHPNDILVNIQLSPYTHPRTVVAGSSTWELRSPSMYDLLQELQSLTNAHCLADYAQYTLHLLHSSFQTYFQAGLRPSKSNNSPEYQILYFNSDIRRKRFFQETTQETPVGDFENLADIELTDIPDPAGLYDFSELSHSVNLSSTSVTHQEEDCALHMELDGQPVPGQPHSIVAADNEVLSSSHRGRQDIPGFVNLPDSAELSEIPGSLNYLEGESVQPILLHEPKCSEIDRMHVFNLKTDCNGHIVGGKTVWQSQLKSCMYRILDFGILEIKKQPRANFDKIYAKMNEDFTYSPKPLDKDFMYKCIGNRLRELRSKWKKKWEEGGYRPWEEGGDRPSECPQAAWKTLIQHWSTEKVMAESVKMKKAREAVKNPSRVGRGGRK
ncbi:unnamed protein product [Sphagnum balticum]